MGYSERHCQICGVRFNLARIRRIDESLSLDTAWSSHRMAQKSPDEYDADDVEIRRDPSLLYCSPFKGIDSHPACAVAKCSEKDGDHAAGDLGCGEDQGYNGWRITAQEMDMMTHVQCVVEKPDDWEPESDDQAFEGEFSDYFLSAISRGTADEWAVEDMPYRHGVGGRLSIDNEGDFPDSAVPFHPPCFEVFRHLSEIAQGRVELCHLVEVCYRLVELEGLRHSDVDRNSEQTWSHIVGTEYLAADPANIPRLRELLDNCIITCPDPASSRTCFQSLSRQKNTTTPTAWMTKPQDPFLFLPIEVNNTILDFLIHDFKAVANLRLSSRAFKHLPQSFYRQVIERRMPWLWEIHNLKAAGRPINWTKLWNGLCVADGGLEFLEEDQVLPGTSYSDRRRIYQFRSAKGPFYRTPLKELDSKVVEEGSDLWHMARSVVVEADTRTILGLKNRRRIWKDCEVIVRLGIQATFDREVPET